MHCSYCSGKAAQPAKPADGKEAVCARCAPVYPCVLTASQGDGVSTLRETMIRQNEGDFLRKSISTVSIQILVYFDPDYKPAGFEITHHVLGLVIKWQAGGPILKYSAEEMMRSYWNYFQLSPNESFDISRIVAEINACAGNLHPFVLDFLNAGLRTVPASGASEVSARQPAARHAVDVLSSGMDLRPSAKSSVKNAMDMTSRPSLATSASITPEERARAEAINASIHELIRAKHTHASDLRDSHDTVSATIPQAPPPSPKSGLTPETKILLYAVAAELIYVISVRILGAYYTGGPIEKEICWTLLRLGSLVFLWRLLRKYQKVEKPVSRLFSTGLISCLAFATPFLAGRVNDPITVAHVCAATSIVVGFREEFFYRGILQGFLRTKLRLPLTLLISNLLFLFYHYGVQPFTPGNVLMLFFTGTVFGLAYELTGSLVFVALLHGAYDIVWAYSPYLSIPFSESVGALVLVFTALILAAINQKPLRSD